MSTQLGRRAAGPNQVESFVEDIQYDPKGRRNVIRYGNQVQTAYHYDPETCRLTALTSTGTSGALQDLSYVYDPVGNITSVADAAQPTVCYANQMVTASGDYTYDALYRLKIATGREHPGQAGLDQRDLAASLPLPTDCAAIVNYQEKYDYFKAGNIALLTHTMYLASGPQVTVRSYNYDGVSNKLVSTTIGADTSSYLHNFRGGMKRMAHLDAMAWNHRDELIGATRTRRGNGPDASTLPLISNPVFFGYDLRGQRVRKVAVSGNNITDRVYVGPYEIYREYPKGGMPTLERETLHASASDRVAIVETLTNGTEELVRYQLSNHLGSSTLELDHNQRLLSYEEYHPYGTTAFMLQGTGVIAKRYRYTGKERDDETGLGYHGARYYAPWLARWTSADPSGLRDGPNAFQFVRSNPIILSDPNGREATRFWGAVRAVSGFAQAAVGVAAAANFELPGIAQGAGYVAIVHGHSDMKAGMRQFLTGREENSDFDNYISEPLKAAGVNHATADRLGDAGDFVGGFVTPIAPISTGPRMAYALASGGQRIRAASKILQYAPYAASTLTHLGTGVHQMSSANSGTSGTGQAATSAAIPAPPSEPVHHIATNKNMVSSSSGGPWTPRFLEIFKKAAMTLEHELNKVQIPGHKGPHPKEYHQIIADRLTTATEGQSGAAYTQSLQQELKALGEELKTVGSMLNKLVTKK